ncbi:MAG: ATP-binding cassette domain-containing protein [Magnetococcales bacterium]|nr:ATP-binding cassette domain-containing protein [Magnetococcales bacterium]
MKEMLRFLAMSPLLGFELLVASFLINLLGLASSLYVIQVLNRYVGSGVDATLFTLTIGAILAIGIEWWMRQLRRDLARSVVGRPMGRVAVGFFNALLGIKLAELLRLNSSSQREMLGHLSTVQRAYTPATVVALLDLPFAGVFVAALVLIHPAIALLATGFLAFVFLISLVHQHRLTHPTLQVGQLSARHAALSASVLTTAESVRVFNGAHLMRNRWWEQMVALHRDQTDLANRQEGIQTLTQAIGALMGVAVIGYGAKLATFGQMDTGLLIGANILAGRAMAPLLRFAQLVPQLAKARQALELLAQFSRLPLVKEEGTALREFSGRVALEMVGYAWPGAKGVLFESLSCIAEPGKLVAVVGSNGTGKTTLLRLLTGVLEPQRGKILIDGYNLSQLHPEWWHGQLLYLPQEPLFLDATLRENLTTLQPGLDDEALHALVDRVGLRRFLNESEQGLELVITEGGQRLSPGIRRRIALARALVSDGKLVVLDEPLEGLDGEGRKLLLEMIKEWVTQGRTVVTASHDAAMAQVADLVIDLDAKPVPGVRVVSRAPRIGGPIG